MTAQALPTLAVAPAYRNLPRKPKLEPFAEPKLGRGRPTKDAAAKLEAARVAHEEANAMLLREHERRVELIVLHRLRQPEHRAANRAWSFLSDAYRVAAAIGAPKAAPSREVKDPESKLENSDHGLKILARTYLDNARHAFEVEGRPLPAELDAELDRLAARLEEKLPTNPKASDYPEPTRKPAGDCAEQAARLVRFLVAHKQTPPAALMRLAPTLALEVAA